jgi:hypothetical protein
MVAGNPDSLDRRERAGCHYRYLSMVQQQGTANVETQHQSEHTHRYSRHHSEGLLLYGVEEGSGYIDLTLRWA